MLSKEEMQEKVAEHTEKTLDLLKVLISKKVQQYVEMDLDVGLPSAKNCDEYSVWVFKAALYSVQLENPHLFSPTTKAGTKEFQRLHQITPSVRAE